MGWGAKDAAVLARLQRRMVACRNCKHCALRPVTEDGYQHNDCKAQPLHLFFTDAQHVCRYFKNKG